MTKQSLIEAFNVKPRKLDTKAVKDYDIFPDKELLDKLRSKIIQDLIDNNIPEDRMLEQYINDEIDEVLVGYDLGYLERNHIFNLIQNEVNGYGPITDLLEDDTITEIIQRTREELITINFKDGTNIKITNDHPLYTELGWKCYDKEKGELSYSELGIVGDFTIGDKLFSLTKYFDKEVVSIEYEEDKTNGYNTYQFEVEKNKNYFANGVLSSAL